MIENVRIRGGILTVCLAFAFVIIWHGLTLEPKFISKGLSEKELLTMEFNGDIIRDDNDVYYYNPDKPRGIPGPKKVFDKTIEEFSGAFEIRGTNDHGVAYLIWYTVKRFAAGFVCASIIAIILGVMIGLSKVTFFALNPFIQVLKPISPLAWMPLLLYSVKDPTYTAILIVFMASLWPTVANTAFGVNSIKIDYLRVASLMEMSRFRLLYKVILPAAAPTIIAGLRISFGSALVAVVPAEMLLGELGIGYLSWMEWNNLDISGIIFAIMMVGIVGVILDSLFNLLAKVFSYPET